MYMSEVCSFSLLSSIPLYEYTSLLIQQLKGIILYQVLAIMNKATIHIHEQVVLRIYMFIFLG